MPQPDENLFNDVGGEQQRGEGYRLVGDRVDKRLVLESLGKIKSFGEENDLRQNQGIDQGKAIEAVAYALGAQHHPRVEREQTENDKEIDENPDEALRFVEGRGFQIALRRAADVGGCACS